MHPLAYYTGMTRFEIEKKTMEFCDVDICYSSKWINTFKRRVFVRVASLNIVKRIKYIL
jgi:hypothetical protein